MCQIQLGADTHAHDLGLQGLMDVIDCAQFQSVDLIGNIVLCCQENDRCVLGLWQGTDGFQCLETVHLRHLDIEQDDVWCMFF